MLKQLPLVIFDGNCQGQHLAAILTSAGIADCYAIGQDLGFVPSHLGEACRFVDEVAAVDLVREAKGQGRPVIQGSQSTPTSDQLVLAYSDLVDTVIRYPHLQFYAISLEESHARFGPRATPRRVFEMDLSIIETCQKRAGSKVDFAGWIRQHAASAPLFHTALHPGGPLTGMSVRSFASQIPGFKAETLASVEAFFSKGEGINSSSYHPVDEQVLAELGFDWGDQYRIYSQMMVQRAQSDWEALLSSQMRYREHFRRDTWCWLSLTQAHTAMGNRTDAEDCLEQLLRLSPGYLHTWLTGFALYQRFDDHQGINELIHKAACFFKGQRVFSQIMAFFMLNLGRPEQALEHARDYYRRTPDRGDALVPLLMCLLRLENLDEMRQIIDYEVNNANPGRIAEIKIVIGGVPELQKYFEFPAA